MSSPLRRVALYLGLVDDGSDEAITPEHQTVASVNSAPVRPSVTPVAKSGGSRFFGLRSSSQNSSTPTEPAPRFRAVETVAPVYREEPAVDRIITLHPHSYNDARMIGEHYREHTPVIMNLTDMDDADAKRLVDFAAGLVFGHRGSIERVTAKVFLLSPPNVKVSAEDKFAAAEASFFNQS